MNIENLKKFVEENGNELKSYRHLCEVLEIKPKGGNQKKSQLKKIGEYIKIKNGKGYRLIIEEINDLPKISVNTSGSMYGNLIQLLIADYIIESGKSEIIITNNRLMEVIKMVNYNYHFGRKNIKEVSEYIKMNEGTLSDYYNTTHNSIRRSIDTALRNLSQRAVIVLNNNTAVTGKGSNTVDIICDRKGTHRVPSYEESLIISDCARITLEKTNKIKEERNKKQGKRRNIGLYRHIEDIYYTADWEFYQKTFKKILASHEKNKTIDYVYKGYVVRPNGFLIDEQENMLAEYLTPKERNETVMLLNKKLCENLVDNAIKRHKKAMGDLRDVNKENKRLKKLVELRSSFSYPKSDFNKFADYMLSPEPKENIEKEMKKIKK